MQVFAPRTVIFKEGDHGRKAYVIREGAVSIVKHTDHGNLVLNTMRKGDIFGEMALVDRGPRSASAIATVETTCSVLTAETVEERLATLSPSSRTAFETMVRYVRATLPWEERRKDPALTAASDLDRRLQAIMTKLGEAVPVDFDGPVLSAMYKFVARYVRDRLPRP